MNNNVEQAQKPQNLIGSLVIYIALFAGLWYAFNWWGDSRVVNNEIERYEIVKRARDLPGMCRSAESVVAAQLYAKHEDEWKKWKEIAAKDCLLFR